MKRFTSFFFALAISAGAVFAQSATESASAGTTKIALQQTENGYEVISVESTGTPAKAADTKEAPAAGKSCCSKKGGASASAAACSSKEAEASKAAACSAGAASASAGGAKPACCASGSHAAAAVPKNPN